MSSHCVRGHELNGRRSCKECRKRLDAERRQLLIDSGFCMAGRAHGPAVRSYRCQSCFDKCVEAQREYRERKKNGTKPEKPPKITTTQREYKQRKFREKRLAIDKIKSAPCADCKGTFDPVCMDFDHRPDEVKSFAIGQMVRRLTLPDLMDEIAKCDLVCSNCHRLRTFRERDHREFCQRPNASKPHISETSQLSLPAVAHQDEAARA